MTKRVKLIVFSLIAIILAVVIAAVSYKLSPSKEIKPLEECFELAGDEMAILMQNAYTEEKGYCLEGTPYVSYDIVKSEFNKRFFFDESAGIMIYTTPDEIIKMTPDSKECTVNKDKTSMEYVPVRKIEGRIYVALPLVKQYSNISYSFYEKPNRAVINYRWDESELTTTVKKDTVIRYEDNIKSPIVANVTEGDRLICTGQEEDIKNGFSKVITIDGVIGYISNKKIEESSYTTFTSDYTAPEYKHNLKNEDVCMVWHQTTNQTANDGLLSLLNNTKGVNVVSPTWFKVVDNEGNVSSIASERYVQRAHNAGVEVWGLCDDFSKDIDMSVLLANMESREKLEKKLLSLAIEYELDGINIDFENIKQEGADAFTEFVREMSVKCKSNDIILSINNYVPVSYREYYDYEEQGKYADYVVIMAYDEHYSGSEEAGSVASLDYVKNAAQTIVEKVAPEQVIMALPFYTRLWTIKNIGTDKQSMESTAYGMKGAQSLLKDRDVTTSWDEKTGQYYAQYDEKGCTNKIWLEDERSIGEKIKAVTAENIHNFSFWRLGFENSEVWNEVSRYSR